MPRSEQGVLARVDGMTGFLLVYNHCLSTPVPVGVERVTSGSVSYYLRHAIHYLMPFFPSFYMLTQSFSDLPVLIMILS